MNDEHVVPEGEEPEVPDQGAEGSFPDAAAEMTPQTEVEAPLEGEVVEADGASAEQPADQPAGGDGEGQSDELVLAQMALAERTADLQRLQAEFVNYKRRVERDRDLLRENATYAALAPITEVLDTIDRAREHGELDAGLKAVGDQLERTVARLGLVKFGTVGDAFDPTVHEALSHIGEDPEVSVTTCKVIAKSGYKIGDRVVRAAQVLVVDPAAGAAPAATGEQDDQADPATEAE